MLFEISLFLKLCDFNFYVLKFTTRSFASFDEFSRFVYPLAQRENSDSPMFVVLKLQGGILILGFPDDGKSVYDM